MGHPVEIKPSYLTDKQDEPDGHAGGVPGEEVGAGHGQVQDAGSEGHRGDVHHHRHNLLVLRSL